MTHYEKKYSGNDTAEDRTKALSDIMDWLGSERFHSVSAILKRETHMPAEKFGFLCGLSGIEGYPVRAWYRHLYGVEMPEEVS
jgi:hypothetical protein